MMASAISEICSDLELPLVYKSSFDKANRTSESSFRGMGLESGLEILSKVRETFAVPVISDVHSPEQAALAAKTLDILQIPAFLCRQSDLLYSAAETGKPVMIKKGQFLHPDDMKYAAEKIVSKGNEKVLLCERGTCHGYRELVVDFRGLEMMADTGHPVVFDATHSVQVMGGAGGTSSGNRRFAKSLARAAVAVGVSAIFIECHQDPDSAPSDGPNMIPLKELKALLGDLKTISEFRLETR
ncbi:UNVERIFIED_CONTAM: hypothetical protein GTU68_060077 [Idotea baltica]|nr:hypothetical protein [Idotea baltica]